MDVSTKEVFRADKHPVIVTNLDEELGQNSNKLDQVDKEQGHISIKQVKTNQNVSRLSHEEKEAEERKGSSAINTENDKHSESTPVKNGFAVTDKKIFRKGRFLEKIVFIISVATLVSLSLSLMNIHWFLPYYYAVSTPILLVIRVIMYWKNKWQYFLFDFCYFANLFCYVYIWVVPANAESSTVLFAVANGPLAWAAVLFRNALVFHDVDRMTSCYIHVLPMALSFGLRWFPDEMSLHWHGKFNRLYPQGIEYLFTWVFAIPLACFLFHSCLYLLVVFGICKPDESYPNILRYLSSRRNSWQGRVLHACGERYLLLTFTIFNFLYSTLSLLLALLFYKYYAAHVVYIALITLIITWNGSTFYIDVFAAKASKPNS